MILARAAYLGAQRNGTVFWSSDIISTWDMLKRSIPAGLNFTATGLPYWDTDIAGFFSPVIPADYHAEHKPLIDGSDVRATIGNYEDYPELFVRWFEWGAFHAGDAGARREKSQRSMVVRQAGGADPREVSKAALPASALHLLGCLSQLPDGCSVYAGAVHGLSRMTRRSRTFRMSICTGRLSWWLR